MTDAYRADSVIMAIEEALLRKDAAEQSPSERVVLVVEALEREVNNGGYNQFFLNEPSYAREVVPALTAIGCTESARIAGDALAVLGPQPNWNEEQISAAAADMCDDDMSKLGELDDEFFAYPDPIEDRLLAYIRAHAAEITL